jgi:hypothetical protein
MHPSKTSPATHLQAAAGAGPLAGAAAWAPAAAGRRRHCQSLPQTCTCTTHRWGQLS